MVPIRCYTCGTVTSPHQRTFESQTALGVPIEQCLDEMGLHRICCRRMLISHPTSLETYYLSHNRDMSDINVDCKTVTHGTRSVDLPIQAIPAAEQVARLHPLRGNDCCALYRFPNYEPTAIHLLADALNADENIMMAWTENPHPLSFDFDLMVAHSFHTEPRDIEATICTAAANVGSFVDKVLSEGILDATFDGNKGSCVLKNTSYSFANTLRRTMLRSIETWAAVRVDIRTNTSSFSDDVIAQRISLCPFRMSEMIEPGNSDSGAEALGGEPGGKLCCSNTKRVGFVCVTTQDIVCSPPLVCLESGIPLVTLKPGESVDMSFVCTKHNAGAHGRHGCVVEVGYAERAIWTPQQDQMAQLAERGTLCEFARRLGADFEVDVERNTIHAADTLSMVRAAHICTVEREFRLEPNTPIGHIAADPSQMLFFWETDGRIDAAALLQITLKLLQESVAHLSRVWALNGSPPFDMLRDESPNLTAGA